VGKVQSTVTGPIPTKGEGKKKLKKRKYPDISFAGLVLSCLKGIQIKGRRNRSRKGCENAHGGIGERRGRKKRASTNTIHIPDILGITPISSRVKKRSRGEAKKMKNGKPLLN